MQKVTSDHAERVRAGLARAAAHGRLGGRRVLASEAQIKAVAHLPNKEAAAALGMSVSGYKRRRRIIEESAANV